MRAVRNGAERITELRVELQETSELVCFLSVFAARHVAALRALDTARTTFGAPGHENQRTILCAAALQTHHDPSGQINSSQLDDKLHTVKQLAVSSACACRNVTRIESQARRVHGGTWGDALLIVWWSLAETKASDSW